MNELRERYPTLKSIPFEIKIYTGTLLLALATIILINLPEIFSKDTNWLDISVFIACSAIFLFKPLEIGKGEVIGLASILWTAAILFLNPTEILILVALGQLAGDIASGALAWAIIFNFPVASISYYLAALTYNMLKSNHPYYETIINNLPAIIIASIIAILLNYISNFFAATLLFKEIPLSAQIKHEFKGLFIYELSQVPIGILLALTYHSQKITLLFFFLPVTLFYLIDNYQTKLQKKKQEAIDEKKRIEQDAHDRIYNRLGALAQKAELAISNPDDMKSTLSLVKDDLRKSVSDLQTIVSGNMQIDSGQDKDALKTEIEMICNNFKAKTSIKLDLTHNPLPQTLDPMIQWHFQCILEECLNNVHKHSQATEATVNLINDNDCLILTVADNGIGLSAVKREASDVRSDNDGIGLSGMRERAAKIGATISFGPNNGAGTRVELRVPITTER